MDHIVLGWQAWLTVAVVLWTLLMLAVSRVGPDMILAAAMTVLLVSGVLKPAEALSGFSNSGVLTVAVLFVVVAGLRETGGIQWLASLVLGKPGSLAIAQLRLISTSSVLSAFVNNTPIVAMLTPAVQEWSRRAGHAASRLLLPLDYATILGGLCTLIGTSTNLIVNGLIAQQGLDPLGMFDPMRVGLPCALVGGIYLMTVGRRLLPARRSAVEQSQNAREYTVEMIVEDGGPLVGVSVEEAGLRSLPHLYLVEIGREGRLISPVTPQEVLRGGDRLVFAGIVDSLLDLRRLRGLRVATDQVFKLEARHNQRCLIEAVVSPMSPCVGRTIRDVRFRNRYGGAVIAVSRQGSRVQQKLGDIELQPGDTLLVEAAPHFVRHHRYSRDFLLISQVDDSMVPDHSRAPVALSILAALVVGTTVFDVNTLYGALLAAAAMILAGCVNQGQARRSIDYQLIVIIACSFALGAAVEKTQVAALVAQLMMHMVGSDPWMTLVIVYLITVLATELLTNNAAAVLMFPIGVAAARQMGVSEFPFVMSIMVGASAGFISPIGYQTHLMVMGPGGYRFGDFVRVGGPLSVLVGVTAVLVAPFVWPF
ncbi:SLC13 family permease [Plasticicumulans acidivorans]|uniref:Di/tricarboxylate transporter n=1 Tax=Plasticicumulans acidivorans TaxID=886464 RepID=A0A317MRS9_9GAMM|nr:SLC13 family permease [Plasticicumulans acidivorans]PWV59586.1 di/tricarboxylate transporter [Plasticicumulans acidivorans]